MNFNICHCMAALYLGFLPDIDTGDANRLWCVSDCPAARAANKPMSEHHFRMLSD